MIQDILFIDNRSRLEKRVIVVSMNRVNVLGSNKSAIIKVQDIRQLLSINRVRKEFENVLVCI
jgi:hypothetical protein